MCALVYLVLRVARGRRLPARWGRQDLCEKSQGSRVGRPCFYSASLASVKGLGVGASVPGHIRAEAEGLPTAHIVSRGRPACTRWWRQQGWEQVPAQACCLSPPCPIHQG